VELRLVNDDVDQGVPVSETDLQPLPGDLGGTAAGHTPLDPQWTGDEGPLWVREPHPVQASAQPRGNGGRQGADQDAVFDDVREPGWDRPRTHRGAGPMKITIREASARNHEESTRA